MRIWGSKTPHAILDTGCNSPKINMLCAVSFIFVRFERTVYVPFIFEVTFITGETYLNMITVRLIPSQADEGGDNIFQPVGGASPH